ncbi:tethering factor for nuclear proteasome STS1 [Trichodelitschia bisporula]|uniref:Tethering factor for nuclear proteasome STS1 n=1 Tax=Trichodelitschia bisporula TaxID=703511 RepID=A0A6G1HTZ8_9PEZI|nr:tethering factor for nuclear proteasome STS1 [Trichodelitschia bisporula]
MNVLPSQQPLFAPHLLPNRHSPSRTLTAPSNTNAMSSRKRKVSDSTPPDDDIRMSASPSASPSFPARALPPRHTKRARKNLSGRPLPLSRLLETLSEDDMRSLLRSMCDRHPTVAAEVQSSAPRPSVHAALAVLNNYESALRAAFPFGNRVSSDYAFNRVRPQLLSLLDALRDYTPHFLPPHETQPSVSLSFLDGVTELIHRLPAWDSYANNRHKAEAYDEVARAWALVVREASKRGGGIQLQVGGWDGKLARHHAESGGKMGEAMGELRASLGWMGTMASGGQTQGDAGSIREQLFNGSYGAAAATVGPW